MRGQRRARVTAMAATSLLIAATVAMAQYGRHHPERHRLRMPPYQASTEVTLRVVVEKVIEEDCPACEWGSGTHLLVHDDGEAIEVHLGPSRFLADHGWKLAPGNAITVTGSRVDIGGTKAILARELSRDEEKLTLRDKEGIPVWSRGGRGT